MNAKEFVNKITQLKPKIDELIDSKYSDEFINSQLSEYDILIKNSNFKIKNNEIFNLIEKYDVSKLRIHDINFLDEEDLQSFENIFLFGAHEIFHIGFDVTTYEVLAYDLGKDEIFLKCASGPQSFLDALYQIKTLERQLLLDKELVKRYEELATETVKECSYLVGGEKYKAFYEYVLGI